MKHVYGIGHEIVCYSTDCKHNISSTACKDYSPRKPIEIIKGQCKRYEAKGVKKG